MAQRDALIKKLTPNGYFIALGVLLALFCSIGRFYYKYGEAGVASAELYLYFAVFAVIFIPALSALGALCDAAPRRGGTFKPFDSRLFPYIAWLFIFLMWVPVWLGAFPGFFSYDANHQWTMYTTGTMTTLHPVLHTTLLSETLETVRRLIGSYNAGIACWCLAQMTALSGVLAYSAVWLKKKEAPPAGVAAAVLFYALYPLFPLFACCTTKDVIFSATVLLFFIACVDSLENEKQNRLSAAAVTALALLMLLLRNNAVYAFVPFAVIFVCARRNRRLKTALAAALVLALFGAFQLYVTAGRGIPTGNPGEALSAPIQQLARTAYLNEDELSVDQLSGINAYLGEDVYKKYTPKLSDPVKASFNRELFAKAPLGFFGLWLDVGKDNAAAYIDAFAANNIDWVYPFGFLDGYLGEPSYFRVEVEFPGELNSRLPAVYDAYYSLLNDPDIISNKSVSTLFSPAVPIWLLLFAVCCAYKNKRAGRTALWFLLLLTATVLLGPIVQIRYVLYLYFCAPLLLLLTRKPTLPSVTDEIL